MYNTMLDLKVIKSNKIYSINEIKKIIQKVLEKYGIRKAYLFGSYSRGEATKDSDIDIIIEKGELRTLLELASLQNDLIEMLRKNVDILTEESLQYEENKCFYDEVCKERIVIYE